MKKKTVILEISQLQQFSKPNSDENFFSQSLKSQSSTPQIKWRHLLPQSIIFLIGGMDFLVLLYRRPSKFQSTFCISPNNQFLGLEFSPAAGDALEANMGSSLVFFCDKQPCLLVAHTHTILLLQLKWRIGENWRIEEASYYYLRSKL